MRRWLRRLWQRLRPARQAFWPRRLQFLHNERLLRLHDARDLHHGSARLWLQTGLRQRPAMPHGQWLARIHGPLELRVRFVLRSAELRLHNTNRHRTFHGEASLATTSGPAAGRSRSLSAAATELTVAAAQIKSPLRQSLTTLPVLLRGH